MAALSAGVLAFGVVIGYPPWFENSMAISTALISVQSVYLWVLRQCYAGMDNESFQVAQLLNLGGRSHLLDQTGDCTLTNTLNHVQSSRISQRINYSDT